MNPGKVTSVVDEHYKNLKISTDFRVFSPVIPLRWEGKIDYEGHH